MKLIDLDQRVIVPVVDESRDGMRYEMQMSIGELLGSCWGRRWRTSSRRSLRLSR